MKLSLKQKAMVQTAVTVFTAVIVGVALAMASAKTLSILLLVFALGCFVKVIYNIKLANLEREERVKYFDEKINRE